MATEIFRIQDQRGQRLGKVFISENPRQPNSWVGHAISFDLSRSDMQWTNDDYNNLKNDLVSFFGNIEDLVVIGEN